MDEAIRKYNRRSFLIGVLLFSITLAVAKPFFGNLSNRPGAGLNSLIDFGFPTQWYAVPKQASPPGVALPADSIGLDFLNFDTYVRNFGLSPQIYKTISLGDPYGRPYVYPPLLTLFFQWVKIFTTPEAVVLWAVTTLILIFINSYFWFEFAGSSLQGKKFSFFSSLSAFIALLFTFSYPSIFLFERGNIHALIFSIVSLIAWMLWKKQWFWVGFLSSLAFLSIIYPIMILLACAAVVGFFIYVGIQSKDMSFLKIAASMALGILCGFIFVLVPLWSLYREYFSRLKGTIHYLQSHIGSDFIISHSMPAAYGFLGMILSYGLCLAALGAFVYFVYRSLCGVKNEEWFIRALTSIMAGMVYVPQRSFDYNLVLLIPIFSILLFEKVRNYDWLAYVGAILLIIGYALPRWLQGIFLGNKTISAFLILQTLGLWLIVIDSWVKIVKLERKKRIS